MQVLTALMMLSGFHHFGFRVQIRSIGWHLGWGGGIQRSGWRSSGSDLTREMG